MTTLLAFVVAIVVLVLFHELGHYAVARLFDVKVLRFSIGFGKVLASKRSGRGETEWALSAVPLGGYVKMLDEREGEVAAVELPRAFNRKPVWQRMAIVAAGPLANFLLAILLYWLLFVQGVPGVKPVLGEIKPGTPAAAAGLQPRDTLLSLDGAAVASWQEVRWKLLDAALQGQGVAVEVARENGDHVFRSLDLRGVAAADLDQDFLAKLGLIPYQPQLPPVLGKLVAGGVAEAAGLRVGDRILAVDGVAIGHWGEVVEAVRSHPGQVLQFTVARQGGTQTLSLMPQAVEEGGQRIGRIGAAPEVDRSLYEALLTTVSYPPLQALQEALRKTAETSLFTVKMLGKMLVGEVSLKNLSGPITIADYAGQSAQLGATAYLGFLALISISLAVLNLLPIPLLDGGHLLYYSAELIKGSPVSERAWQAGQQVGIVMLITMMAFALYNDISRLISG